MMPMVDIDQQQPAFDHAYIRRVPELVAKQVRELADDYRAGKITKEQYDRQFRVINNQKGG